MTIVVAHASQPQHLAMPADAARYVLVDRARVADGSRVDELLDHLGREGGVTMVDATPELSRLVDDACGKDRSSLTARERRRLDVACRARDLMTGDLSHAHTIEDLARTCGVSTTMMKSCFKEAFGAPVYTWYRTYRIHCACEKLRDQPNLPIAQVAAEVGYANPSKFSKAFADTMGVLPREWRSMHVG